MSRPSDQDRARSGLPMALRGFVSTFVVRAGKTLALVAALSVGANAQTDRLEAPHPDAFVSVAADTLAITGVQLIDGTGRKPASGQTMVIRDGLVAAVGATSEVQIPEGAEVLERSGYTVIPGQVGLHEHTYLGGITP